MKIEFCVSGVSSSEEDCRRLGIIVGHAAEQMGVAFESIDEVIVATPDQFGDVVARFDPSRKYTNSRGLVAAGKTIPHRKTNTPVTNSILLQYSVVRQIFDAPLQYGRDFFTWPAEPQRNFYVLQHELGHCLDHSRRDDVEDDGTYRTEDGQRAVRHGLSSFCAYHHSMLLGELTACAHAAHAYTDGVRALDCEMNNQFMRAQIADLMRRTIETPQALGDIRAEGIGLFWFVLFQQAKFTGAKVGNPDLPSKPAAELWEIGAATPEITEILASAEAAMEAAWPGYPVFESSLRETLSNCFADMAAVCGYRFQDPTGRDGIWWDRPLQLNMLGRLEALARPTPP